MGTAENKALIQRIYADSASRSGTTFADHIDDETVWIVTGQNSWSHTFVGKDAILNQLMGRVRSLLTDRVRTIAYTFIADGDHVVVETKGDNVTKSGMRYDNEYCMVWTFDRGQIRQIKEYCDSALVEKALGLFPTPVSRAEA